MLLLTGLAASLGTVLGAAYALELAVPAGGPQALNHVFIAGVAADESGPSDSGSLTAGHLGFSTIDGSGAGTGLTVYGLVHNGTGHPVSDVTVAVTATSGGEATVSSGPVSVQAIPAAGDAPFTVLMPADATPGAILSAAVTAFTSMDSGTVVSGLPVTAGGALPVPIGPPDKVTHIVPVSPNLLGIAGTVVNNTGSPVRVDHVAIAFIDASGAVELAATTGAITAAHPGSDPNVLAPGEAGTFEVLVPRATLLSIPGSVTMQTFVSAVPAAT
jgi:hypothetical protein